MANRLAPYDVQLYRPDTTSAYTAMDYLPLLLTDPVVADRLAFVGFHQYFGDPSVGVVADYVHAQRPDMRVVVTEYTSFSFGDLDAGQEASSPLDFTLDVTDTVLAHYRLGADAALYWDAIDYLQPGHDAMTSWGLLRSPAEDFARREWYYGLLQILRTFSLAYGCSKRCVKVAATLGSWPCVWRTSAWRCSWSISVRRLSTWTSSWPRRSEMDQAGSPLREPTRSPRPHLAVTSHWTAAPAACGYPVARSPRW
jgi:hypothetical protein